ncbi:MAG: hypothetical protein RXS42_06695 [Nitrososphaeria archaeon]
MSSEGPALDLHSRTKSTSLPDSFSGTRSTLTRAGSFTHCPTSTISPGFRSGR